jgi:hypothetical protein
MADGGTRVSTKMRVRVTPRRVYCAAEDRWYSVSAYRRKMIWQRFWKKLGLKKEARDGNADIHSDR